MIARLMLTLAALLWAGNYAVGRVVAGDVFPVTLSFLRWAVALFLLLPFASVGLVRNRELLRRHAGRLAALALTGVVLHPITTYTALHYTSATSVALIMSATPATILLIDLLLHNERPGLPRVLFAGVSFAGIAVLLANELSLPNGGDLLTCIAMISWAAYCILLRDCPAEIDNVTLTAANAVIGLCLMVPLVATEIAFRGGPELTIGTMLAILYVGLFASGAAFLLWNRGVAAIGSVNASQYLNLMPVFGIALGRFALHEAFTLRHAAATILIVGGLILSAYFDKERPGRPLPGRT